MFIGDKFPPSSKWLSQLRVLFVFLPVVVSYDYKNDAMAPVILVPGVVGSMIEGRWKTTDQPKFCDNESNWELLWLRMKTVVGSKPLQCWVFRYKLIYDKGAHRSQNQIGVETRPLGDFGSLKPVEYLTRDPITQIGTGYFNDIGKALRKDGYSTDINLKAAAYDGRYAPPQQEAFGYFARFTELVEKVANDSKRKVAIFAHSMGGLVAAYFLVNKPQEWKDKYIHAFIPVSTPWLGSPMAVAAFIIGANFGVPTYKLSTMRELVRTFQSVAFLLPAEEAYKDTVLVGWPERNKKYTSKDYKQLFLDINYEDGFSMREDVRSLMPVAAEKLGVKVFCVWSKGVKTKLKMIIEGDIKDPKNVNYEEVDGDGTVTLDSLEHCKKFPMVTTKEIPNKDHLKIVYSDGFIDYIKSVLVQAEPL